MLGLKPVSLKINFTIITFEKLHFPQLDCSDSANLYHGI